MKFRYLIPILLTLVVCAGALFAPRSTRAGEVSAAEYKVLEPIRHGNLTIFPVAGPRSHDTSQFVTLDEGLKSGDVVVTEAGNVRGLIRRHGTSILQHDSAEVNRLVLMNNSKRPLLLLAGEIVAGGKQDRVIGKDRIVPPESDPVDLSVFCVEQGRWVASSEKFGASGRMYGGSGAVGGTLMAQPSVRAKAMGEKNQAAVWSEVAKQREAISADMAAVPGAAPPVALTNTTSYARVMENEEVKRHVDEVAAPMEHDYQSLIRQLKDRNAVGVVVAMNGRVVWADVFASTELLEKYWPKLVRSYASEAVVTRSKGAEVSERQAQRFLDEMEGRHETIENEPGVFRHTEVNGDGFKAFELTSLLPKTGFDLHVAKMAE